MDPTTKLPHPEPTRHHGPFYLAEGVGRTHLIVWRGEKLRWKVPCGRVQPDGTNVTYWPTKPLCQLCDKATRHFYPNRNDSLWQNT